MNSNDDLTRETSVADAVSAALLSNPATARYAIGAEAQGSTVNLTGEVDNQQDKEMAEQIARGVPGVVAVINELTVAHDEGGLFGGRSDTTDGSDTPAGGSGIPAVTVPAGAVTGGSNMGGPIAGAAPGAGLGPIIGIGGTDVTDSNAGTTPNSEGDNITS